MHGEYACIRADQYRQLIKLKVILINETEKQTQKYFLEVYKIRLFENFTNKLKIRSISTIFTDWNQLQNYCFIIFLDNKYILFKF